MMFLSFFYWEITKVESKKKKRQADVNNPYTNRGELSSYFLNTQEYL